MRSIAARLLSASAHQEPASSQVPAKNVKPIQAEKVDKRFHAAMKWLTISSSGGSSLCWSSGKTRAG
jgi:hypothetical protein